jgi:hypothetical protein
MSIGFIDIPLFGQLFGQSVDEFCGTNAESDIRSLFLADSRNTTTRSPLSQEWWEWTAPIASLFCWEDFLLVVVVVAV